MDEKDIHEEIIKIKERNSKVETDKAWETSLTRKLFIGAVTYVIASMWLVIINDTDPFLKAFVPVAGYILSTLSLPFVKKWWTQNFYQN